MNSVWFLTIMIYTSIANLDSMFARKKLSFEIADRLNPDLFIGAIPSTDSPYISLEFKYM